MTIDLAHRIDPTAKFFYLDTDVLFEETYTTRDALAATYGIEFERYGDAFSQDERGIARDPNGPPIAWFKDPAGNIISVIQTSGGPM